ncbi:glycosyltransferase [Luminiphilus sp.]|nr:glycosyltransferase [Luminiphilus sp.]
MLKFFGRKVIFDCHEDFPRKAHSRSWIPSPLVGMVSRVAGMMLRFAGLVADGTIVAAPSLYPLFPGAKNLVLIRNASDPADFSVPGEEERLSGLVFYSGGLTPDKGVEQVIEAILTSTLNLRLVIVGKEVSGVRQRLGRKLSDTRIDYRGPVSYDEVKRLMGTSQVGVVCNQPINSYDTALPNKLFEYMAAGLPTVYSHFPHWREMCGSDSTGCAVDPVSPEAIRKGIESIINDTESYLAKVTQCRQVAERNGWPAEKKKLVSLYDRVIEA